MYLLNRHCQYTQTCYTFHVNIKCFSMCKQVFSAPLLHPLAQRDPSLSTTTETVLMALQGILNISVPPLGLETVNQPKTSDLHLV